MIKRLLICFYITCTLCISCDDDEKKTEPIQKDFYAFGKLRDTGVYWENSEAKIMDGAGDIYDGLVSGSDVYAVGTANYGIAAYWKNGKIFKLSDGSNHEQATAIVISGSDIYIAGYGWSGDRTIAKYWKNGIAVELPGPDGFAMAVGIAVSGSDVHIIGWADRRFAGYDSTLAMYWKNDSWIKIKATATHDILGDIELSGNDVYIAGTTRNETYTSRAQLWKNGEPTPMTDGSVETFATQLEIIGDDIYVAGRNDKNAAYWKNGVVTPLETDASFASDVTGMITIGDRVVISGINYYPAFAYQGSFVWRDGKMEPPFTGNDGAFYVTSIAPKK